MGYRFLEHTADVMIEAHGASIGEAFSFAAKAMFDVMIDTSRVVPRQSMKIKVSAKDLEGLLYSWLEELLYRFDVKRIAFSEFEFTVVEKKGVMRGMGEAKGELYDPGKHSRRTEVKAVTYEEMLIAKTSNGFKVRFILDI
nr:archease [Candidatus Njordarchaeum guaymaensis]